MEQRDYLMRQFELFGQALARALARLLNMKQSVPGGLRPDEIKQVYSDELDLSLDLILETPGEDLVEVLTARVNFSDPHLDRLAEILAETAGLYESSGDRETTKELLEKSIRIYEHRQKTSGIFSMERMMRIRELQSRLQSLL